MGPSKETEEDTHSIEYPGTQTVLCAVFGCVCVCVCVSVLEELPTCFFGAAVPAC